MHPQLLVKEIVQQNKLLKETISHFPILTSGKGQHAEEEEEEEEEGSSPSLSAHHGREDGHSTEDAHSDHSMMRMSPTTSSASSESDHAAAIQVLLNLLDRQESRLDLLEQLGKSVLLESSNNSIPVFRGLRCTASPSNPPSPITSTSSASSTTSFSFSSSPSSSLAGLSSTEVEQDMDVREWTKLVLGHLNCLKSLNSSSSSNSKEVIRFIYNKLEREPLHLLQNLLHRNRLLVLKQFPSEVPPKFRFRNDEASTASSIPEHELLLEFPFKLYLLRYPNALLNLLNSKFSSPPQPRPATNQPQSPSY